MALYEIVLESQNPCGGSEYAQVHITEQEVSDIHAYVNENAGSGGTVETFKNPDGSTLIVWDCKGYIKKFTFTEI